MTAHDPERPTGPVRTCIGCRGRATKRELLRVVAGEVTTARGTTWGVVADPGGSAPGRGAHLHPVLACLELAERKRAFTRALRHDAAGSGGALDLDDLKQYFTTTLSESAPT